MGLTVGRVQRHVAHVDLDQVMQDQHADGAVDIDAGLGLPLHHHRIEGQVPAMLGTVFLPRQVVERIRPLDRLQPVGLDQKVQPLRQLVAWRSLCVQGRRHRPYREVSVKRRRT